ncbi:uncharacterized protein LOC142224651 [Haematobia irritans]|uniref:uncharacterized protein LOC142224651 n=1 Tax=Haematobia irritans TaxID=7368 RepID=UPI003F4FECE6
MGSFLDVCEKTALSKAERRAIQEAQRAPKDHSQAQKASGNKVGSNTPKTPQSKTASAVKAVSGSDKVSPNERPKTSVNLFGNNSQIHPSVARLGEQYAKRTVVGSNARCIAFLNAMKMLRCVIQDFETPPKKEFARSLESLLSNGVVYAHKNLKQVLMQLPHDQHESELKEKLFMFINLILRIKLERLSKP